MSLRRRPYLVAGLIVLAGCAAGSAPKALTRVTAIPTVVPVAPHSTASSTTLPTSTTPPRAAVLAFPQYLVDPRLNLRAPPVPIPLQLELPSVKVIRPMLAVGITTANIMDAPEGAAQDPVWQDAFWYRGGSIPGQPGTATIAGHVDDSLGRPATFAHLGDLRLGDPIVVRDLRTGTAMDFVVTETDTYTLADAATPPILSRIYGLGPVLGTGPRDSPDGLSHLTLITCTGTFNYRLATHDHRLVVYAVRVN